jgi:hypothetical protein
VTWGGTVDAALRPATGIFADSAGWTSILATFVDSWRGIGATARQRADSVCGRETAIRGAEPTAGISGTVGFVYGLESADDRLRLLGHHQEVEKLARPLRVDGCQPRELVERQRACAEARHRAELDLGEIEALRIGPGQDAKCALLQPLEGGRDVLFREPIAHAPPHCDGGIHVRPVAAAPACEPVHLGLERIRRRRREGEEVRELASRLLRQPLDELHLGDDPARQQDLAVQPLHPGELAQRVVQDLGVDVAELVEHRPEGRHPRVRLNLRHHPADEDHGRLLGGFPLPARELQRAGHPRGRRRHEEARYRRLAERPRQCARLGTRRRRCLGFRPLLRNAHRRPDSGMVSVRSDLRSRTSSRTAPWWGRNTSFIGGLPPCVAIAGRQSTRSASGSSRGSFVDPSSRRDSG